MNKYILLLFATVFFIQIRAQDYLDVPRGFKLIIRDFVASKWAPKEIAGTEKALLSIVALSRVNKQWHEVCNEKKFKKKVEKLKIKVFNLSSFHITEQSFSSILPYLRMKKQDQVLRFFVEEREKILKQKSIELKSVHINPSLKNCCWDCFSGLICCPSGLACEKRIKNDYKDSVQEKYGIYVDDDKDFNINYGLLYNDYDCYDRKRSCVSGILSCPLICPTVFFLYFFHACIGDERKWCCTFDDSRYP